jgi:p-cumate 2,3-dioxygenase alpha subunit
VAALEAVQQGFAAWRDVQWNDLSRGMARNDDQLDTDEGHLRVFWRRWSELMETAA